jgi:hypothetical protein
MAKVVIQPTGDRYVSGAYNWLTIAAIGAGLGVLTWVIAWLLGNFVVDPLLCRDSALQACGKSGTVAGNLAIIVTAIVGAVILIRSHIRHALWVVLAIVLSFWGLHSLTESLSWIEALLLTADIFALGYVLFIWIIRLRSTTVAVVLAIAIALTFRWIAFL